MRWGAVQTTGAPILAVPLVPASVAGTSRLGQQVDRVQSYAYFSAELKGAELQSLSILTVYNFASCPPHFLCVLLSL